jgi:hypothetical protein
LAFVVFQMDLRGVLALGMHCTVSQPASKPGRPRILADCQSMIWAMRRESSDPTRFI